jgi:oxygen-independent coproporphyrinogen III oxidase
LALPEPPAAPHNLSLYVHVPFCTDKCLYCDFFSLPRRTVTQPVIERVVEETVALARQFLHAAGNGTRVETIFIGGGTPSCLPPALLRQLLGAFSPCQPSEWTVESNPETLSESFLDECERAGVNRLSVGIQSLRSEHLAVLQRRATRDQALSAMSRLKRRWKGRLNLDFITGIPGQTEAEVREDLAVAADGWPDHVSLYQLTVEPGTPLEAQVGDGTLRTNDPARDEELWLAGREELQARGYRQYEVSNFALPGMECAHNLRYWRLEPYCGAGPGAVSTVPGAWAAEVVGRPELSSPGAVVRLSAPRDIKGFLQGSEGHWGLETEVIRPSDFLLECLMMGLRIAGGVREDLLRSRFGSGLSELFPGLWERWVGHGQAHAFDGRWRLTPAGLLILDHLLGEVVDKLPREIDRGTVTWPP